jgi:taurine dioxygenase
MTSVELEAKPVTGTLGAEIVGLSGSDPIGEEVSAFLRQAVSEHGVIFIRDQGVDPKRHMEVAQAVGEIKPPVAVVGFTLENEGYPQIGVISSDNGLAQTSAVWHTDGSFVPAPISHTVLHMQVCPPAGGDTVWASQYAIYESLAPSLQEALIGLTARHVALNRPELFHDHPVVIAHPVTGRRALFTNALYAKKINELSDAESDAILRLIEKETTRPEMQCRWRFSVGDIVLWDNLYVQHYAIGDYGWAPRKIHRIEINGPEPVAAENREATAVA